MELKRKINWPLTSFGVAQLLLSGYLLITINFNLGQLLLFLFAAACVMWGIYFEAIRSFTRTGLGKGIKYLLIGGIFCWIGLIAFITYYGGNDTSDFSEDAVIVLGAGIRGDQVTRILAYRLDKCAEYWLKNPSALIVVSGGQGWQETVTEAFAMKKYLLQKGIPESNIIMEEQASSTYKNFLYSKELLDSYFHSPDYRISYITNNFHAYRAGLIAEAVGFSATRYSAGIDWYMIAPNYARESLAVLKTWILGA